MYIRDNFFDKPDEIRALALAQEYGKWGHNNYPGYRSKMICEIDMDLWDELSLRLMQFPVCSQMGLNVMKAEFAYVPGRFGKGWPSHRRRCYVGRCYISIARCSCNQWNKFL